MPEAIAPAQGEQSVQTDPAPPQSVDKPETTTTQTEGQSDFNAVADLLDIPPEMREQISGESKQVAKAEEKPEPEKVEVTKDKSEEDESDEDESDEDEKPEKPAEQRVDKRQKRINRLTRKLSDADEKIDTLSQRLTEASEKLQRFEKNGQAPVGTIPKVGPWMPDKETADNYSDLSQKKELAKARITWCNKYRNGVTITENGQERFIPADEVESWRDEAQESLTEINPELKGIEREAKQKFKEQRNGYDNLAVQFWPELADKSTEEFQLAASILKEYPEIAHSPSAHYSVGLVIEGMKSLRAKHQAKNGNGKSPPSPAPKHKDIDERVFTTPRVPIAPHEPEPPTRESSSSSQKQLDEATNSFMNDPDGGVESLAKVFAARESLAKRPASRTPVTR